MNMMNATNNDNDDDIVDVDNGAPSIILLLSMVEKGHVTRNDQIQYFIEHFGSANPKTKQILQDNIISLIATLAYDDLSSNQDRQREMVKFQLMTISIEAILANYKLKDYPQDKVHNIVHCPYLYRVIKCTLL